MPQQLASFSGPAQLSVAFLYRNAGWGLGMRYISLTRLPQQLHEQHGTPCFLFCPRPGLTQPVLFLLYFDSAAGCYTAFDSAFPAQLLGSSVVCEVLHGSLREHDCAILTTPEASLQELSIGTWL